MRIRLGLRFTLALALAGTAPARVFGFQFDVWRSGMKEEQVLELAKQQNVSISGGSLLGGLLSGKKGDEPPETVEHRGEMKLFGYDAKVHFGFTPESKLLHTLRVELSVPMSGKEADVEVLANAIAKQLDKKYKETSVPTAGKLLDSLTAKLKGLKKRAWEDGRDLVVLQSDWGMLGGSVAVVYADKKLVEQEKVEDLRIREKRLERQGGRDKAKF